jgi:sialate O-acetylesterase
MRLFLYRMTVLSPTLTNLQGPRGDLTAGHWKTANHSEDVLEFSAVAYFFAENLYKKYRVPIGIINSSVGGTPIEAWTSEEGFKDFPSILQTIEKDKDTAYINSFSRRPVANMSNVRRRTKGLRVLTPGTVPPISRWGGGKSVFRGTGRIMD